MKNEHIALAVVVVLLFLYVQDVLTLKQNGWVLYYTPTCPYCVQQLGEFGWKSALLSKVNCKENECPDVQAYPTWINSRTGEKVEGVVKKDELYGKLL